MLDFKHLLVSAFAILALAQAGFGQDSAFSSPQGRVIYKDTKIVDGQSRTIQVTASSCQKKSKYLPEPAGANLATCTLQLYCDITAKTSKTSLANIGVSEEHSLSISNVVMDGTCPKAGGACPEIEKCIADSRTIVDSGPALEKVQGVQGAQPEAKSRAQ